MKIESIDFYCYFLEENEWTVEIAICPGLHYVYFDADKNWENKYIGTLSSE